MTQCGSLNQIESSDLTTMSFGELSGLPSNLSMSVVMVAGEQETIFVEARIEDLNRGIRIALARLPGCERFVCGCSERRGSTDRCEGITSRMHWPYSLCSASIGSCVVECSSKGIRPRVIAQQNIELATVSQRGAASIAMRAASIGAISPTIVSCAGTR